MATGVDVSAASKSSTVLTGGVSKLSNSSSDIRFPLYPNTQKTTLVKTRSKTETTAITKATNTNTTAV
jgi:hypothetical protein